MKAIPGATPLAALDAVAFDTETTGLDTAKARIIEIGAIHVDAGKATDHTLSVLTDPKMPIPAASTAVHGITDAMVAGQSSFAAALAAFTVFSRSRVLIGHSIGFDFAIMAAEAKRCGLTYAKPRALCIRVLGQIANPSLPDYSLDMLANWLGVTILDRHRALGDARAAAAVFVAMVPALAAKGIRTLAEAERASLALTREMDKHEQAGWAKPVNTPGEMAPGGRIDSWAYSHRVADVMSGPPICMPGSATLAAVISVLAERKISSVFTSDDGAPGGPASAYGIITERDILRLMAKHGAAAFALSAGDVAVRPVHSIRSRAFIYRAVGRMDRLKVRHLAVRSDRGLLEGMVSARDLLRQRAAAAIALDDAIEVSANAVEMGRAFAQVPDMAGALIGEGLEAPTVAEIISEEIRAMTRRAAVLAEASMLAEGAGAPPCAYALLVLGSGGRGESLLAPDQDNAIVFAEGEPDGATDLWFARLAEKIADTLDAAGVPYCKGGVMARNAQWRGSLTTWRDRITHWVSRSTPQDILQVDIFYDMLPVHGDMDLGGELFAEAFRLGGENASFAKLMAQESESAPNPFTFLGGLRGDESGRIDLKIAGLFPIVAMARALAIRHGVEERSTRARMAGLAKLAIGGERDFEKLSNAHSVILAAMLRQQRRDIAEGRKPINKVEIASLKATELAELKAALSAVSAAPVLARDLMFQKHG